jgi:hypothetical protein
MSAMVLKAASRLERPNRGNHWAKPIPADLAHSRPNTHFLGFSAHDWGSSMTQLNPMFSRGLSSLCPLWFN